MPTPKDRAETRGLAADIVESVRNDVRMPLPLPTTHGAAGLVAFRRSDVEQLAFRLAQEVALGHDDLMNALAELQGARGEAEALRSERPELTADDRTTLEDARLFFVIAKEHAEQAGAAAGVASASRILALFNRLLGTVATL